MNQFSKILLGNLLLNKGPQDFPHSNVLMRLTLIVYFIVGFPSTMLIADFETAVLDMTIEVIMLMLFVYVCLQAFSKSARFVQTITAMASVSVVFKLAIWPLLNNISSDSTDGKAALSFIILLMLYSWLLAAYTHIFRESFGIRLPAAMVLTISYVVISLLVAQIMFPEPLSS